MCLSRFLLIQDCFQYLPSHCCLSSYHSWLTSQIFPSVPTTICLFTITCVCKWPIPASISVITRQLSLPLTRNISFALLYPSWIHFPGIPAQSFSNFSALMMMGSNLWPQLECSNRKGICPLWQCWSALLFIQKWNQKCSELPVDSSQWHSPAAKDGVATISSCDHFLWMMDVCVFLAWFSTVFPTF